MAHLEHVDLARRYAAGERDRRLEMLDLSGADLSGLDFSHAWLRDTDLSQTDLRQEIELQSEKINYEDVNSVDNVSRVIQDLINDARFPEDLADEILKQFDKLDSDLVAERSSATAEDSSTAS